MIIWYEVYEITMQEEKKYEKTIAFCETLLLARFIVKDIVPNAKIRLIEQKNTWDSSIIEEEKSS